MRWWRLKRDRCGHSVTVIPQGDDVLVLRRCLACERGLGRASAILVVGAGKPEAVRRVPLPRFMARRMRRR